MSKKKRIQVSEPEPIPSAAEQTEQVIPVNRGPQGWIRVRANGNVGEADQSGRVVLRTKGQEFEIDEARARALGPLVERI